MAGYRRSAWMTDFRELLKQKTLKELVLPGSHNSGMTPPMLPISRNQDAQIIDQLIKHGVRFLDLRPGWNSSNKKEGEIHIYHGRARSLLLGSVLNQIKSFMSGDHQELLLIALTNYRDMNDDLYKTMWKRFETELSEWLILPKIVDDTKKRLADIPLEQLTPKHGGIILLSERRNGVPSLPDFVWEYTKSGFTNNQDNAYKYGLAVYDVWSNQKSLEAMKKDQIKKYNEFSRIQVPPAGAAGDKKALYFDLFLFSWVLSPFSHFARNAKKSANPYLLGTVMNEMTIPRINQSTKEHYYPNILYADAVDSLDLIEISLNLMQARPRTPVRLPFSGRQYDKGVNQSIATANNIVLDVHQSNSKGSDLYYIVGMLQPDSTVQWSRGGTKYDTKGGLTPDVALNSNGRIVEVHKSNGKDTLYYWTGDVAADGLVSNLFHGRYCENQPGKLTDPSVALDDNGRIVAVHQASDADENLFYIVGELQGKTIQWKAPAAGFARGSHVKAALNNHGTTVALYTARDKDNTICYRVGRLQGDKVVWGESIGTSLYGTVTDIALNDTNDIVLLCKGRSTSVVAAGHVSDGRISWKEPRPFEGEGTTVSLRKDTVVIGSGAGGKLFYDVVGLDDLTK